jgi:hypothetical protein
MHVHTIPGKKMPSDSVSWLKIGGKCRTGAKRRVAAGLYIIFSCLNQYVQNEITQSNVKKQNYLAAFFTNTC